MQDLGTLGTGTNAIAQMINNRGQVVGWSYTSSAPAPLCILPLTTGTFIWDTKNGMRDIGGLGGTCTYAIALNNRGQIVGGSTLIGDLEIHAFVWDAATGITELPTTAGLFADARAINENGEAVGWGEDPSGTARDAMLWRKRGGKWQVTDVGRLNAPDCAVGTSINASGQVLGYSGPGDGCLGGSAFLWEDGGPIVDLNTLIPPNSGIQLYETGQINDRGEIAVNGLDANKNNHDILLIPCDENHADIEGCDYSLWTRPHRRHTAPRFPLFPARSNARLSRGGPIDIASRGARNRRATSRDKAEEYVEKNRNSKAWTRATTFALFAALSRRANNCRSRGKAGPRRDYENRKADGH